jgi:hypothetical protein
VVAGGLADNPQISFQLILSKSKMRRLRNGVSDGPTVQAGIYFNQRLHVFWFLCHSRNELS